MLQHADGYERVAALVDLAVVVLDERHASVKVLGSHPLPRESNLLFGIVVGDHVDAVVFRHMYRQRTPAAACFDDLLPGLQLQFAAYVIEFGDLRFGQCRGGRVVVGTGINHAFVEPQPVKVVAQVVVMAHVVPGAIERVDPHCVQQRPNLGTVIAAVILVRDGPRDLVGERQHIAVDLDQSVRVTLAKAQGRRSQ